MDHKGYPFSTLNLDMLHTTGHGRDAVVLVAMSNMTKAVLDRNDATQSHLSVPRTRPGKIIARPNHYEQPMGIVSMASVVRLRGLGVLKTNLRFEQDTTDIVLYTVL